MDGRNALAPPAIAPSSLSALTMAGMLAARSYVRLKPPEAPETDEEGEYALYWETSGDDAGVVSRHSTYEDAKQALDAKDWPRPGDNTHYLCGYSVRMLVSGDWVAVDENGEAHQD
jgi:hypothetical protein